eukprot:CAMPEP_0172519548 /NCGR_PEP_ID=MMETSP1066-20121228/291482_1 /TAXON_ID=671091 /ORGANISM="Coscinodiscus wailesii, Strain CCMP2513" /LENGTH=1164 /DNA_ID=CAMNT_0013302155 /DNA_START=635 /DNA_END=4129 /DNA_ORIENTATION=-
MVIPSKIILFILSLWTRPVSIRSVGNDRHVEKLDTLAALAITDTTRNQYLDERSDGDGEDTLQPLNALENAMFHPASQQPSSSPHDYIDIVIRLTSPPVGKWATTMTSRRERDEYRSMIVAEQNDVVDRIRVLIPEMELLARTQLVMNALFVRVPPGTTTRYLEEMLARGSSSNADLGVVARVALVGTYQLSLSDTVPFIFGDKDGLDDNGVERGGYLNGTGVTVAVIDSGIDYTHKNLGGEGTVAAFERAYGTNRTDNYTRREGWFPTEKVVEGYDFVGEWWPYNNGTLEPDDDPIDLDGHGTSVADIIAGVNGVAPGARLIGIKACSSIGTGCNGIALVQAVEYAIEQEVDIINLSLGSPYGQPFDDDLSYALKGAHDDFGILVVASGGNCDNKPYCTSTPASEPSVLSVAQTVMPDKYVSQIELNGDDYVAPFFTWSKAPLANEIVSGPLQYADGENNNTLGCEPFAPGSLDGYIVLVDRGVCYFTAKVLNIEMAGGIGAIIGNNIPGEEPFVGGFSGNVYPSIPGYMISAADAAKIKQEYAEAQSSNSTGNMTVIIDPSNKMRLPSNEVARSSARGPDMSFNRIKPEIGAPGQSLSAVAGSGDKERNFSGTSGAAPMVAGAAALIKQSCPNCTPLKVKSLLMNTANRDTTSDATGASAAISRIGAGILRVDKAIATTIWAYSLDDNQPSLSLGVIDAADSNIFISRKVLISNNGSKRQELKLTPTFRSEDKQKSGAIRVRVRVGGNPVNSIILSGDDNIEVEVMFHIRSSLVPANAMSSGIQGADPTGLDTNEFDGYIIIGGLDNEIALPWHVLARRSAKVTASRTTIQPGTFPDKISLMNNGAGVAQIDTFDLLAISDEKERGAAGEMKPTPDIKAIGFRTVISKTCESDFALQFAVSTWDRQTHLLPVTFLFDFDMDGDGFYETHMYSKPMRLPNDARVATYTTFTAKDDGGETATQSSPKPRAPTGPVTNFFVGHGTNSANTILTACGEQLGLQMSDLLYSDIVIHGKASALDSFHGGPGDDQITTFMITPFGERFTSARGTGLARQRQASQMDIEPGSSKDIKIYDFGSPYFVNATSYGLMIITNGHRDDGRTGAATEDTEVMLVLSPGVREPRPLPDTVDGGKTPMDDYSGTRTASASKNKSRGRRKLRGRVFNH